MTTEEELNRFFAGGVKRYKGYNRRHPNPTFHLVGNYNTRVWYDTVGNHWTFGYDDMNFLSSGETLPIAWEKFVQAIGKFRDDVVTDVNTVISLGLQAKL